MQPTGRLTTNAEEFVLRILHSDRWDHLVLIESYFFPCLSYSKSRSFSIIKQFPPNRYFIISVEEVFRLPFFSASPRHSGTETPDNNSCSSERPK